ncbi:helix-turn-helix domain-containing protein [Nocardia sp. NPDC051570]|uniref:helix-turn-helix domain-containing protein n=1 Tax=Nocardia sp. NPDC051570 TaxID=3364324 RepID=UPI00378AA0DC
MRPIVSERELGGGWELVRPTAYAMGDVVISGFRDRTAAGLDMSILALPAITVAIQFGDSEFMVENAVGRRTFGGVVAGLSPGAHRLRGSRVECVEVRLAPSAAYSLLGVSPRDLNGMVVGLDDTWGRAARRLREQLAETASWDDRFALTARFLESQRSTRAMDPEVAACWDRVVVGKGRVRVRELAEFSGWSRKRLWSRFTAQVGVTPKHAAMVVRFRCAFEMLLAGESVSDVAVACGYTDQSHLHRDVTTFAAMTPGAVSRIRPQQAPSTG